MILGIGHIEIHSEHRKELQWRVGHFIIAPHANLYHNGRVLQSIPHKVYLVPEPLNMQQFYDKIFNCDFDNLAYAVHIYDLHNPLKMD